jgi:glycosyltransferase involved in cell wall biosynthesis
MTSDPQTKPLYSVIIPAFNEAQWLPGCLNSVKEAMESVAIAGEVVVVDNNSTDNTADIAREHGAKVVFESVNQISRARNAGARAARGEFLVFLDADTLLPAELLTEALDNLRGGDCCGGGGMVSFDRPVQGLVKLLIGLWHFLARRFGLAAGCFVYCRRDGFDAIGGFNERVYASEEVWFSRQLGKWGKREGKEFRFITSTSIVTSARKLDYPISTCLTLFTALFFPPAVYSKWLCWIWYHRRPRRDEAKNGPA